MDKNGKKPFTLAFTPGKGLWERLRELLIISVIVHYFFHVFAALVFLGVLIYLGYWYISALIIVLYLPSFFNGDQYRLGRQWEYFRQHRFWRYTQNYLNVRIIREQPLDSSKQYIFAIQPHGILILSRASMYGGIFEQLFPGITTRTLAASPMFYIPICREISLFCGAVDAGKNTALQILKKGWSLIIYPGGSKEIFETNPHSHNTNLVARSGFLRLAMESGCQVVPAFVFGEKWLYNRFYLPHSFTRFFMKTLRLPLLIFWGRFLSYVPIQKQLATVYGRPLTVPHIENPTRQQVEKVEAAYRKEVQRLFDHYKVQFGYSEEEVLVFKKNSEH